MVWISISTISRVIISNAAVCEIFDPMKRNKIKLRHIISLYLLLSANQIYAQTDEAKVEQIVKNSPCAAGLSIDEVLRDKIKTGSQRDLGWQVFTEGELYDVERAFLLNKSMQLRFRWHVNADGSIAPVSDRAKSLCDN